MNGDKLCTRLAPKNHLCVTVTITGMLCLQRRILPLSLGLSVPAVKWPLLIPVKTVSFSLNGNLASMNTIPLIMASRQSRASRLKGMCRWLFIVYINPRKQALSQNLVSLAGRYPVSRSALSYLVFYRALFCSGCGFLRQGLGLTLRYLKRAILWLLRVVLLRLLMLWLFLFLSRMLATGALNLLL
ncbi:hypothetical protein LMBIIBHN_01928 [Aeromonas salmonicida]